MKTGAEVRGVVAVVVGFEAEFPIPSAGGDAVRGLAEAAGTDGGGDEGDLQLFVIAEDMGFAGTGEWIRRADEEPACRGSSREKSATLPDANNETNPKINLQNGDEEIGTHLCSSPPGRPRRRLQHSQSTPFLLPHPFHPFPCSPQSHLILRRSRHFRPIPP